MRSLPNVEQKRALRTYHFQLGATKSVNLDWPNGQDVSVLAPCESFLPYKSVKNPTAFLKISFASGKLAVTIDHGYNILVESKAKLRSSAENWPLRRQPALTVSNNLHGIAIAADQ